MDLRRLDAFCKVYELKSFSKAGNELFLSQPTISAHVAALEKTLGVDLFDRLGRSILPTPAGDTLYRYAREAFTVLDTARAEIELLQNRVSGEVKLGGSTIPAHFLLPAILSRFAIRYPDVSLQLSVGSTNDIIRRVVDGELILGIVGAREEHKDLEYQALYADQLVIVAAPSMGLNPQDSLEKFFGARWVLRESGSGTRKSFESALAGQGHHPNELNVAVEVESTQAAVQCTRAGLGMTVTSRLAVDDYLATGELVEIPMKGLALSRTIYCVNNERRNLFPAVRYLADFIKKECRGGNCVEKVA